MGDELIEENINRLETALNRKDKRIDVLEKEVQKLTALVKTSDPKVTRVNGQMSNFYQGSVETINKLKRINAKLEEKVDLLEIHKQQFEQDSSRYLSENRILKKRIRVTNANIESLQRMLKEKLQEYSHLCDSLKSNLKKLPPNEGNFFLQSLTLLDILTLRDKVLHLNHENKSLKM